MWRWVDSVLGQWPYQGVEAPPQARSPEEIARQLGYWQAIREQLAALQDAGSRTIGGRPFDVDFAAAGASLDALVTGLRGQVEATGSEPPPPRPFVLADVTKALRNEFAWADCDAEESAVICQSANVSLVPPEGGAIVQQCVLPFYPSLVFASIRAPDEEDAGSRLVLIDPDDAHVWTVDLRPGTVFGVNRAGKLDLTEATVAKYASFFLACAPGKGGPLLRDLACPVSVQRVHQDEREPHFLIELIANLAGIVVDLVLEIDGEGRVNARRRQDRTSEGNR
jgi:hypothetical protein